MCAWILSRAIFLFNKVFSLYSHDTWRTDVVSSCINIFDRVNVWKLCRTRKHISTLNIFSIPWLTKEGLKVMHIPNNIPRLKVSNSLSRLLHSYFTFKNVVLRWTDNSRAFFVRVSGSNFSADRLPRLVLSAQLCDNISMSVCPACRQCIVKAFERARNDCRVKVRSAYLEPIKSVESDLIYCVMFAYRQYEGIHLRIRFRFNRLRGFLRFTRFRARVLPLSLFANTLRGNHMRGPELIHPRFLTDSYSI